MPLWDLSLPRDNPQIGHQPLSPQHYMATEISTQWFRCLLADFCWVGVSLCIVQGEIVSRFFSSILGGFLLPRFCSSSLTCFWNSEFRLCCSAQWNCCLLLRPNPPVLKLENAYRKRKKKYPLSECGSFLSCFFPLRNPRFMSFLYWFLSSAFKYSLYLPSLAFIIVFSGKLKPIESLSYG